MNDKIRRTFSPSDVNEILDSIDLESIYEWELTSARIRIRSRIEEERKQREKFRFPSNMFPRRALPVTDEDVEARMNYREGSWSPTQYERIGELMFFAQTLVDDLRNIASYESNHGDSMISIPLRKWKALNRLMRGEL